MTTRRSTCADARRRLALAVIPALAALALEGCGSAPPPAAPSRRERQLAALRELGFKDDGEGWEMDIAVATRFQLDDDRLLPADQAKLAHVAQVLLAVGIDRLTVEGHTDNLGTAERNRVLSGRRAKVVADELVASGFAADHIERKAFGASRPIADNATQAGRERNRRAVLIVPSL